jgi:hypothetical protein
MPVILDPHSYDLWLDPGSADVPPVSELLKRFDAADLLLPGEYAHQSRPQMMTRSAAQQWSGAWSGAFVLTPQMP